MLLSNTYTFVITVYTGELCLHNPIQFACQQCVSDPILNGLIMHAC